MADFSRRDFLKAVSLTGTAAVMGCSSEPARKLIPYIIPPEDIIPGEATWYATTCRECPAGCGLLAKNRDGHIIKAEGNPLYPVNQGKLCARGQASVQGLYNPDRYRNPLRKKTDGSFEPISWEAAEQHLLNKLMELKKKGGRDRAVFLTELITGTQKNLITLWLEELGAGGPVLFEPFAYEPLRQANEVVFGLGRIPTYHIDQADFLLSFSANFLEAWLSNVQYARQFTSFHAPGDSGKNLFIYVGPRLSMTAANADHWIAVSPENQSVVALGIIHLLLAKGLTLAVRGEQRAALEAQVRNFSPEKTETMTGVKAQILQMVAEKFSKAKKPLALAEGLFCSDTRATETAIAANLLCALSPGARQIIDFDDPSSLGEVVPAQRMKELTQKMLQGEIELLVIDRANPLFHLPPAWEFLKALKKVPMVVSFSSFPDETCEQAHLVLPTHTFLESWGDYSPRKNVEGLLQPVMGPMFNTRHLGDILLSTGRKLAGDKKFPWKNFYEMLRAAWAQNRKGDGSSGNFWQESLQRGGTWSEGGKESAWSLSGSVNVTFTQPLSPPPGKTENPFNLVTYPTIQFFDGRTANRPFLQEMPDPMTNITWGGWVELNMDTAKKLGISKGDVLTLRSAHGTLQAPAYPYPGIPEGILAMPIGQGHAAYGRFARSQSGNPIQLIPPNIDPATGTIIRSVPEVSVEKLERSIPLANTDGSLYQYGRGLAQGVSWPEYQQMTGQKPPIVLPLPEGFTKRDDFYPPHQHPEYRWVMVVDLDRCIGCGACVVACYAENNVAVVGKDEVLRGREMSWLHIERYFEATQPMVQFLPMLCQHCDEAPCEAVCPMFAPNHSRDGINNQVYNRCIGTRFCSQNCPYKARRFNWFTWPRDESLNWQLNPDVTVRHKGVMEKCSFCIQRIVAAKVQARSEDRKVRDGEFTTACAQTCPADVFTFGNLKDPDSRVAKLIQDPRAYQVLGQLNTKPAVIYLKKIIRKLQVVRNGASLI